MHWGLESRVRALEERAPDPTKPLKAIVPEWLIEDLEAEGIRFDPTHQRIISVPEFDADRLSIPE